MSIEGSYSGHPFAYTPIEKNYDIDTRLHEVSHAILTESTPWGKQLVLLQDIREIDTSRKRTSEYYPAIIRTLINASEFVYESYALLFTLHFARKNNDQQLVEKILRSDYAKIYNEKFLKLYMLFSSVESAFELCTTITQFALDTWLLDDCDFYWLPENDLYELICSDYSRYYPDYRFKKLVDSVFEILPQDILERNLEHIDLEFHEIIKKADLDNLCLHFKTENIFDRLSKVLNYAFKNDNSLIVALGKLQERISSVDFNYIRTNSFDIPTLKISYEPFQFTKEAFPWINENSTLLLNMYDEEIELYYFINICKKYTIIKVFWSNVKSYIDVFKNEIIIPFVDYQLVEQKFILPPGRLVFYFIECIHDQFKQYLIKLGSDNVPYIHFRKINETTYAIFALINQNRILFCFQKSYAFTMFVDDVKRGEYKYVQLNNSLIDGIFYKEKGDHSRYGEVIKAMLQVDDSGSRINL